MFFFEATANDPEQGNLTTSIQWSGSGTPATGSGDHITKTFDCATLGNRTVTASVTDAGGATATDSVVVNIVNPNGPPAAPSSLRATVSGANVILNWNDNSSNEDGFRVYRRTKSKNNWSSWAPLTPTTGAGITTFTDANVPRGTYQYHVVAYTNAAGPSGPSNTVQVKR